MADPELEAIRQRRMQELMAQRGMGNPQNSEQQKAQEDAKSDAEERRQMMLSQILSSEARERRKFTFEIISRSSFIGS
ncbi:programmed cell death 5-a variant [Populus alba x Populus x berolinensis]|uniref:Programmed cell death 5-a variant n=1 Tax=Populus alba x Populus x berolinensis TaxID=444605 RepID=A0AAD6RSH5_9ROSI|nr:programmed cell death 5-a variant [Populus alba x Populus x berolinensis]